jgi:four helix bundle protein
MDAVKGKNAEIWDQINRGALSVVLNLNEANARKGRDKMNRFSMAEGSAREVMAAIQTAVDWGYVNEDVGEESIALFDRTIAMLVRLRFPRPKQPVE